MTDDPDLNEMVQDCMELLAVHEPSPTRDAGLVFAMMTAAAEGKSSTDFIPDLSTALAYFAVTDWRVGGPDPRKFMDVVYENTKRMIGIAMEADNGQEGS